MNIGRLARLGKKVADKRGGVEGLKSDATELREIAKGEGGLKEKAKRAAEALKEPGTKETPAAPPDEESPGPRGSGAQQQV